MKNNHKRIINRLRGWCPRVNVPDTSRLRRVDHGEFTVVEEVEFVDISDPKRTAPKVFVSYETRDEFGHSRSGSIVLPKQGFTREGRDLAIAERVLRSTKIQRVISIVTTIMFFGVPILYIRMLLSWPYATAPLSPVNLLSYPVLVLLVLPYVVRVLTGVVVSKRARNIMGIAGLTLVVFGWILHFMGFRITSFPLALVLQLMELS